MATGYKPIILNAPTFDVTQGCTINFAYYGGLFTQTKIEFRDNSTDSVAATLISDNSNMYIQVAPNTSGLSNNKIYNITISVNEGDEQNSNWSDKSNKAIIYCFSTPTFTFLSPTQGSSLTTSYAEVTLNYSQSENEPLDKYRLVMYDNNDAVIASSGDLYDIDNNGNPLPYIFNNYLENGAEYHIIATAVTLHGMTVNATTNFTCEYIQPESYAHMTLTNLPDSGSVSISSNVIALQGVAETNPPVYINNKAIDLRNNSVTFSEGFNINQNFIMQIKGRNFTPFKPMVVMKDNKGNEIVIQYCIGLFESYQDIGTTISTYYGQTGKWCGYFELKANLIAKDGTQIVTQYVGHSNYFNVIPAYQEMLIWVQRGKFSDVHPNHQALAYNPAVFEIYASKTEQ